MIRTWSEIANVYQKQSQIPEQMLEALSMLDLVKRLRRHPELSMVYRSTAHRTVDGLDTLILWLPEMRSAVHVVCNLPDEYTIYVDHQGITPDTYYSQRETVTEYEVVDKIREQLWRTARPHQRA
jgi:hypothetical protein